MATLAGSTIAATYTYLLKMDGTGGITGSLVAVQDGDATSSSLKISTSKVEVIPASDSTALFEVSQADGTAVLSVDTSNARVGIGTSAPGAHLELANSAGDTVSEISCWSTNEGHQPRMVFQKSGNATIDTLTPTEVNENLGVIEFNGVNNAGTPALKMGAYILAEQDAAKDATAVPTRLMFGTSDADDDGTPTERMRIDSAGKVGIGETAPSGKLHITDGDGQVSSGVYITNERNANNNNYIRFRKARQSTGTTHTVITSGDYLGEIAFQGCDVNDGYETGATIYAITEGTISSDQIPTSLQFHTENTSGTHAERMRISADGNVGIGDTDPSEAKLSIDGVLSGDIGINLKQDQAQIALNIDQNANSQAIMIDAHQGTSNAAILINAPINTTNSVLEVTGCNSLTTGGVADFYSNSSTTDTRNLVKITNEHASASGTTGLFIDQDANGISLNIDSEATTNHTMVFTGPAQTEGFVLSMADVNALTTGSMAYFHSNSSDSTLRKLVNIINANGSATGAVPLFVQNDAGRHCIGTDGGGMFLNETANANMSLGLTINQGGYDNEILAFKSGGDVAHNVTAVTEADTYGFMAKGSGTNGGLLITGITQYSYRGLFLEGICDATVNTTKSTSGYGCIDLQGILESGNDRGAVGSNGNLVTIGNNGTQRFIFDVEGSFHADVESTTFDHYNDANLVRAFDLSHGKDVIASKFDDFIDYNHETLADLKLVGREEDGTPNKFVNVTKMQQLHNGAIWQQYTEMQKMKELMYDTMVELIGKEKADAKLKDHDIKLLDENTLLN